MKKQLLWLVILGLLLFPPPQLHAQVYTIFGPTLFERTRKAPAPETVTFSSLVTGPRCTLIIENGNGTGKGLISCGTILLNGTQIVKPQDFNQQQARIEKTVTILEQNQLTVDITGKPGASLNISVIGEAPSLEFITPQDGEVVTTPSIALRGKVETDTPKVWMHINGEDIVNISEDTFYWNNLNLEEGANSLTFSAMDTNDQRIIKTITVHAEYQPSSEWLEIRYSPKFSDPSVDETLSITQHVNSRPVSSWVECEGPSGAVIDQTDLLNYNIKFYNYGVYTFTVYLRDSEGNVFQRKATTSYEEPWPKTYWDEFFRISKKLNQAFGNYLKDHSAHEARQLVLRDARNEPGITFADLVEGYLTITYQYGPTGVIELVWTPKQRKK